MCNENKSEEVVETYNDSEVKEYADVFGSYTGNSQDGEKPVQDADDL